MNESNERQKTQQVIHESGKPLLRQDDELEQNDQFPGSYFRIPAPPQPGKTTWRLV